MNVRDRVSLADGAGTHYGTITVRLDNGMCAVKWDSGITENVHEAELTLVEDDKVDRGAPAFPSFENNEELPEARGTPIDGGAPGWREKLTKLWARIST